MIFGSHTINLDSRDNFMPSVLKVERTSESAQGRHQTQIAGSHPSSGLLTQSGWVSKFPDDVASASLGTNPTFKNHALFLTKLFSFLVILPRAIIIYPDWIRHRHPSKAKVLYKPYATTASIEESLGWEKVIAEESGVPTGATSWVWNALRKLGSGSWGRLRRSQTKSDTSESDSCQRHRREINQVLLLRTIREQSLGHHCLRTGLPQSQLLFSSRTHDPCLHSHFCSTVSFTVQPYWHPSLFQS